MDNLTVETLLDYITSHGGRVRNSKLVNHFKDFLNHPDNKVTNREKFKGVVNEVAVLKTEDGEKIVVLKKKYCRGLANSSSTVPASADSTSAMSTPQPESEADFDSPDGGMMSKARADENMTVAMRQSNRVPVSTKTSEDSRSLTSSASLTSSGSQKSLASSTSGVASMDEDANTSIDSVKDKIKKLNKNISESDLTRMKPGGGNKKIHKHAGGDDENSHSYDYYINLNPEQKHWLAVCSASDYQDMSRLLSKNPGLAKLKDLTNTGLHWAAKSGKGEVIKLLAKKPGVVVDDRSGYTALHLAAMHGHEDVIDLLVQTYKADVNVRDYSGKKAKQYLKNGKTQHFTMSRKHEAEQSSVKTLGDSLTRSVSTRKSKKSKGVTSLVQAMSAVARQPLLNWGTTADHVGGDERDGGGKTPPGSAGSSPGSSRQNIPEDVSLMHPPSVCVTTGDSPTGSQSSSRAPSPSTEHVKEDSENTMRCETGPGVEEKAVDVSAE